MLSLLPVRVRTRSGVLAVLFLVATQCLAADRDCEAGATNMAEVRQCVQEAQEHDLTAAFDRTLSFVRSKDKEAARRLVAAQKSWQTFAADSCEYTIAARQTARMEDDARAMCWQSFIDARIRVLEAYRREFGKVP